MTSIRTQKDVERQQRECRAGMHGGEPTRPSGISVGDIFLPETSIRHAEKRWLLLFCSVCFRHSTMLLQTCEISNYTLEYLTRISPFSIFTWGWGTFVETRGEGTEQTTSGSIGERKPSCPCWTHVRDAVVVRGHVPGLETVHVERCLPLHQRRLPFESRRHEEHCLGCPALGEGFRQAF